METSFCFGPSGSFTIFNAGVAYYLAKNIPFKRDQATIYVVSGGAVGLAVLLYKTPEEILEKCHGVSLIMGQLKNYNNPYAQMARLCREGLDYFLPDDAHEILGDRIYIGMTHWPSLKRHAQRGPFPTKAALLEALLVSAYIPGFFLNFPHSNYRNFIDGGFSHAYCKRPERSVVTTVSRHPDSDIWHDEGRFHFNLMTAAEYMAIFWAGVAAAEQNHDKIVSKLRINRIYQEANVSVD